MVGVVTSLEEAHKLAAQWLNPVLACTPRGSWIPAEHSGRSERAMQSIVAQVQTARGRGKQ